MAAKFKHGNHLVQADKVITGLLGPTNALPVDADVGKVVKRIADSAYGLCADGDEFVGIMHSINQGPTDDGYKIGGVWMGGADGMKEVGYTGAVAVNGLVVANATGGVKPGAPTKYRWEVVAIKNATVCVIKKV